MSRSIMAILSCFVLFGYVVYTEKKENDYEEHLWTYAGWLKESESKIERLEKELKAKDREKICLFWYPHEQKIEIEHVLGGGVSRPIYYRRDTPTKLDSISIHTRESLLLYLKNTYR